MTPEISFKSMSMEKFNSYHSHSTWPSGSIKWLTEYDVLVTLTTCHLLISDTYLIVTGMFRDVIGALKWDAVE